MAQQLYGLLFDGNTYGVLHLKLMGSLVAILHDFYNVENVDEFLLVSDIAFIMHVGGRIPGITYSGHSLKPATSC